MPTTTTPYMDLMLPVVSVEPGPTWASDLNAAFTLVDSHDHTTGKGLQVPTAGLNINADLSVASFNITSVRTDRYVNQGSPLSLASDLNCVYVSSGNLYFNNSSGQQVQITAGSTINASGIGAIGGDYASSTALEFYTSATKTFTFWQNTNTYANIEGGNLLIHEPATSTNAITLKSPTSLASSYNLILPVDNGSDGYALRSTGSGILTFHPIQDGGLINYAITASVASNALTIALKGVNGSDPSTTNKVTIEFKNTTDATGTSSYVSAVAATSVVVSSGSTLGSTNANPNWAYVYAINNAGTVELAVSGSNMWDEGNLQSTTAEGGAGAADDKYTLYSTTARTTKPIRLIGRVKSTQTTAGTWASAPSQISLRTFEIEKPRSEVWVYTANGYGSTNNKIRRWTTIGRNIGTGITLTQDASNGDSFTINEDGIYAISFADEFSASDTLGVSLNSAQLSTSIDTITAANRLVMTKTAAANIADLVAMTASFAAGDVVRAHNGGTASGTLTSGQSFRITKISQ